MSLRGWNWLFFNPFVRFLIMKGITSMIMGIFFLYICPDLSGQRSIYRSRRIGVESNYRPRSSRDNTFDSVRLSVRPGLWELRSLDSSLSEKNVIRKRNLHIHWAFGIFQYYLMQNINSSFLFQRMSFDRDFTDWLNDLFGRVFVYWRAIVVVGLQTTA